MRGLIYARALLFSSGGIGIWLSDAGVNIGGRDLGENRLCFDLIVFGRGVVRGWVERESESLGFAGGSNGISVSSGNADVKRGV